jgi:hypothetical protein
MSSNDPYRKAPKRNRQCQQEDPKSGSDNVIPISRRRTRVQDVAQFADEMFSEDMTVESSQHTTSIFYRSSGN